MSSEGLPLSWNCRVISLSALAAARSWSFESGWSGGGGSFVGRCPRACVRRGAQPPAIGSRELGQLAQVFPRNISVRAAVPVRAAPPRGLSGDPNKPNRGADGAEHQHTADDQAKAEVEAEVLERRSRLNVRRDTGRSNGYPGGALVSLLSIDRVAPLTGRRRSASGLRRLGGGDVDGPPHARQGVFAGRDDGRPSIGTYDDGQMAAAGGDTGSRPRGLGGASSRRTGAC
jgi:hypothetical protein